MNAAQSQLMMKYVTAAASILAVLAGLLCVFETPRNFVASYVGLQYQLSESSSGTDGHGMYGYGLKDLHSVAAFLLPLFLVGCIFSDLIQKCHGNRLLGKPADESQFVFRGITTLLLVGCILMDIFAISKEEFWTASQLWYDGLPEGNIPYLVKLYLLMQLSIILYTLSYLVIKRNTLATFREDFIDGIINLFFGIFCYTFNFAPLLMLIFVVRLNLDLLLAVVQLAAFFMAPGGGLAVFGSTLSRAHKGLLVLEQLWLMILAFNTCYYGNRSPPELITISALIGLMVAVNSFRVLKGRRFELGLNIHCTAKPSFSATSARGANHGSGEPPSTLRRSSRRASKTRK